MSSRRPSSAAFRYVFYLVFLPFLTRQIHRGVSRLVIIRVYEDDARLLISHRGSIHQRVSSSHISTLRPVRKLCRYDTVCLLTFQIADAWRPSALQCPLLSCLPLAAVCDLNPTFRSINPPDHVCPKNRRHLRVTKYHSATTTTSCIPSTLSRIIRYPYVNQAMAFSLSAPSTPLAPLDPSSTMTSNLLPSHIRRTPSVKSHPSNPWR